MMRRLTQQQIKAIHARNKSKGLRAVINALRSKGHRASSYRTVWHGTIARNIPSIKRHGIKVSENEGYVFAGKRPLALSFADEVSSVRYKPVKGGFGRSKVVKHKPALVQLRVPKRMGEVWTPQSGNYDWEWVYPNTVATKYIKKIGRVGPSKKKPGFRWLDK